jgi:homoserine O-acetyltransferase
MNPQCEKIGDLALECGRTLRDAQVAYQSLGELAPNRDNVVLVLHGFTSGPDIILPTGDPAEGSWHELVGPGKVIDTDRHFVLCPNAIGSTYGSTSSASIDPQSGKPYGSSFPPVTVRDVVKSQHALLERLGIQHLVATVGASFGGLQALQWGASFPSFMDGIVAALASLGPPPTNVKGIRAGLARDPNWNGGDYYDHGNLIETLVPIRVGMLKTYGVEQALAATIPDPAERHAAIERRARAWAEGFDANAVLVVMKTIATHDVRSELHDIRARVLYLLSRTDPFFPPTLSTDAMARFKDAGIDARYFEIDSDNGHSAATSDAWRWGGVLRNFLEGLRGEHCT